jgi:anti-sigma B factor antagonist
VAMVSGARVEYPATGPIRVVGDIDLASADALSTELMMGLAGANGVFPLDLSEVSFMDSTGIRMLLGILRAKPGTRLDLSPVSPAVERVLTISGFPMIDGVISMGPLEEEGL